MRQNKEIAEAAEAEWMVRATPKFINYSEEIPQAISYSGTSIKGMG